MDQLNHPDLPTTKNYNSHIDVDKTGCEYTAILIFRVTAKKFWIPAQFTATNANAHQAFQEVPF